MKLLAALTLSVTSFLGFAPAHKAEAVGCADANMTFEHPDIYRVLCLGRGRVWFQAYSTCYKPVWIVEDGVVVDFYKEYQSRKSRVHFKSRREYRENIRLHCTSTHPFLETNQWLAPFFVRWS